MSGAGHILRFAVVGGAVALLYLALYVGFLHLAVPQVLANGSAFLIAVAVQYLGQAGFTFRREVNDRAQMLRFAIMIGFGLLTSALITGMFGPALGLADWLAACIVVCVLPVQNFIIMSRWVFARGLETSS